MEKRIPRGFFAVFTMIAVAFALCLGTASPAFAANTPAQGDTMTFNKYLVMDANANVPNVTFKFTIEKGEAVSASGGNPAIYAGVGEPTVGSAEFAPSDTTDEGTPTDEGASGSKYATEQVTVDFSGVTFDAPGIYRYVITETTQSQDGITNDTKATRTVDVYVAYKTGSDTELKVTDYVMYFGTKTDNTGLEAGKSDGFTNAYATNDLTLEKQVTGNQGDRDKYFAFTVSISNAVAGTVYGVDLTGAEVSPNVDGETKTNQGTLTATGGTVTATYYLKDDQKIVIKGLTPGTDYNITEGDYSGDGYATTHTVDLAPSQEGRTTGDKGMGNNDHEVVFTNHKEGAVPTGILLETGPFILMGAVVLAALIALLATGRRCARR